MGVLRLNGKAYGGGIDVIEVTQAQYNALPESKLSDDILYVISDSVNGSDGYPPLIYSTEEREVGVWTDGKPLYQKTVYFGQLTNNTSKSIAHGIANVDRIIKTESSVLENDTYFFNLPFVNNPTYDIAIWCDRTNITITPYSDRTSDFAYVTLWYTKTTDTKGSGRWTTQGTLAQHYSTTERLIGTWIDGKPIYQKSIEITQIPNQNTQTIAHNIANIDRIVNINGICYARTNIDPNYASTPLPRIQDNSTTANLGVDANRVNIVLKGRGTNFTEIYAKVIVTIQYTKTTD